MDYIQHNAISQLAGVPVISPKGAWTFPNSSSSYGSGGPHDPVYQAGPYIAIRPKFVRGIRQTIKGNPQDLWFAARSWKILANEYAHASGQDQTDVGGFDGGLTHRPTTVRLMRELMTRAGVRPRLQNQLVKRASRTFGVTTAHPSLPAPPPLPPGQLPTIG